jgi:hypothetical protein
MGVGDDDSWGARPHEQYILREDKTFSYRFKIIGIDPEKGDIGVYARQIME